MTLALRMLSSLPNELSEHSEAVVLADAWFASNSFIEGIYAREFRAVLGIRGDRRTVEDKPLTRLKQKGSRVRLKGLTIPVWVSWFHLKFENGEKEQRFVISSHAIAGSRLVRLGRVRWKIEAFFKTVKYTFAPSKCGKEHPSECYAIYSCRCSPLSWPSPQNPRPRPMRCSLGVKLLSKRRYHSCLSWWCSSYLHTSKDDGHYSKNSG